MIFCIYTGEYIYLRGFESYDDYVVIEMNLLKVGFEDLYFGIDTLNGKKSIDILWYSWRRIQEGFVKSKDMVDVRGIQYILIYS